MINEHYKLKDGGLWISFADSPSKYDIIEKLQNGRTFSRTIELLDVAGYKTDVAIVSFSNSSIDCIVTVLFGAKGGPGERKITLTNPIMLDGIIISELRSKLSSRTKQFLPQSAPRAKRISPALWESIISEMLNVYPDHADQIGTAIQRRSKKPFRMRIPHEENSLFKYDANLLAADIFSGRKCRIEFHNNQQRNQANASFQDALSKHRGIEDALIDFDSDKFPGFALMEELSNGVSFLEAKGRSLTIINANRTKIEKSTGVDLIYFDTLKRSFVMVQYKCLRTKSSGAPTYYPSNDKNLQQELNRMDNIQNESLKNTNEEYKYYRLNTNPFYFKLCENIPKSSHGHELLSGLYMPKELFELALEDPFVAGKNGGKALNFETCSHRLTNTEFARLYARGFIGSTPNDSMVIQELIKTELNLGRQVVAAYESQNECIDNDFPRDETGRFTTFDDPLGEIF